MSEIEASEPSPGLTAWLEIGLGKQATAYALGYTPEELDEYRSDARSLLPEQQSVLEEFTRFHAAVVGQFDGSTAASLLRVWSTQTHPSGKSMLRALHEQATGVAEAPEGDSALERALAEIVLDAYPALLLPPDPRLPEMPGRDLLPLEVARMTSFGRRAEEFQTLVMHDDTLARIFTEDNDHSGVSGYVYRNTGGGSVQLSMLAQMALRSGRIRLAGTEATAAALAREAIASLRIVRRALANEPVTVSAKVAFTGVLLPEGAQLDLGNAQVRAVTTEERNTAPDDLKQQLGTTDDAGRSVLVNYDGDVLLDYKYPYRARAVRVDPEGPPSWPEDMRPDPGLETTIRSLRFALMLAVSRDQRAQLVPTWRTIEDPLAHGNDLSWSDPRQTPGLVPMQLTAEDVDGWREWYDLLSSPEAARIALAVSRILRAVAERREPMDVLIDAVIAWESLFGTKEGEPTFRVTMCLAALLEEDPPRRLELKSQLGKLYALRSKVVHGSGELNPSEYPQCQQALEFAIRAVRKLLAERSDLLRIRDTAVRSATLLLGARTEPAASANP